ncbi:hypothetical protein CHARACLAT_000557 [Characodon lateralis]|uniref:Uncharacterized protein n=1 Tax=Characodon lateralis TaxID=208331 RepID=A0ABU7EA16_9TELE|nr:hypothetical protein [Characodon lateralis]
MSRSEAAELGEKTNQTLRTQSAQDLLKHFAEEKQECDVESSLQPITANLRLMLKGKVAGYTVARRCLHSGISPPSPPNTTGN